MKSSLDDEAIVTGHEPGKGKHVGRMGALHCRLKNGKTFKVGPTLIAPTGLVPRI